MGCKVSAVRQGSSNPTPPRTKLQCLDPADLRDCPLPEPPSTTLITPSTTPREEEEDSEREETEAESDPVQLSMPEDGKQDVYTPLVQSSRAASSTTSPALGLVAVARAVGITAVGRRALEISAVLAGTVLLGIVDVMGNEIYYDSKRRMHYLSSAGLGYTAWVVWGLGLLNPSVFGYATLPPKPLAAEEALSEANIYQVFHNGQVPPGRMAKFAFLLARAFFNVAMILYRFISLPLRDPGSLANEAKHAAGWVELFAVVQLASGFAGAYRINDCIILGTILEAITIVVWCVSAVSFLTVQSSECFMMVFAVFILLLVFATSASTCYASASQLRGAAQYSVLGALAALSPASLSSRWNHLENFGCMRVLIMAIIVPFYAAVAMLSLVVKVAQLDFIALQSFAEWNILDWLNVLAFANNVAGIVDHDAIARRGVFEQLRAEDLQVSGASAAEMQEAWSEVLGKRLQRMYGPCRAVFHCATLSPKDYARLLCCYREGKQPSNSNASA